MGSERELRNTTRNVLIMFVLNTNFGEPNNQTGYSFVTPNRKSGSPSGATCFETVDDLGGADGLAGNSLNARSQDSFTNYQFPKGEIIWNADYPGESPDSQCDDGDLGCYEKQTWDKSWYEQVRLETGDYHDVEVPAF